MLFIKAFTSYFHINRPPTPSAVSYVSTGLARLPRDTNASPIYRRRAVVETSSLGLHPLVAERRHSSVTRYAKRSVACRDSPRHQTLRAGGTPLPRHPSDCASPSKKPPSSSDCANGAIHHHRRKTAEERFNMLARGWLAYPVTPTHAHLPPKSGCINVIPAKRISEMRHTQRAEPPSGSPALRLNELLFFYSITFCALPSTTTT